MLKAKCDSEAVKRAKQREVRAACRKRWVTRGQKKDPSLRGREEDKAMMSTEICSFFGIWNNTFSIVH